MFVILQFFSAGLPQNGEDEEGFEGFLEQDVLKEVRRAGRLVRLASQVVIFFAVSHIHMFQTYICIKFVIATSR